MSKVASSTKIPNATSKRPRGIRLDARAEEGVHPYKLWIQAHCYLTLLFVTAIPIPFTTELWSEVWTGVRPQAWDGSGHFALAQIYSQSTFPDIFGWTDTFFAGIPHPNNYPPLFYWLIALLDRLPFISFLTAFKIVLTLPTLLLPAATWLVAWKASNKNRLFATCAALAITPLLVDYRFFISSGPLGITYMSTFLTGLYSHPLGYLFLLLWYVAYSDAHQPAWRIALSSLFLALTLLSSFFSASITGLFIVSTLVLDFIALRRTTDDDARRLSRRTLLAHFVSPLIAGLMTLFWLAPVIATRDYIVTQPTRTPFSDLVPLAMWVWYALALIGILLWIYRRQFDRMLPYLATCLVLAVVIFTAGLIAPPWFPMHPARMIATFNFLLAVPVGITLAFIVEKAGAQLGIRFSGALPDRPDATRASTPTPPLTPAPHPLHMIGTALAVFIAAILLITSISVPSFRLAFYPSEDRETIDPILSFAREHRDGRYIVEIPPFSDTETAHDGRAINNYLGAQGNEVISLFFREISPSVVFFSPLANTFSVQADPFGVSSVLADDKSFAIQPPAEHLRQLQLIGVRYLVIRSPWARQRLAGQARITAAHEFGMWTIHELGDKPVERARVLNYRPALMVSELNLKGRRQNDYGFVRFAEEQIASGWYDVMLARSSEQRLDRLALDEDFGALIVDAYEYEDETKAYERLREIARHRPVILVESDDPLFTRIRSSLPEFPQAEVVERPAESPGEWIAQGAPTRNYNASGARNVWRRIQRILDNRKIAVDESSSVAVSGQAERNTISLRPSAGLTQRVPVLVNTTFHPNWWRADGAGVYPITPFFMLTFVQGETVMSFARSGTDWAGVIVSAMMLLVLCMVMAWYYGNRFSGAAQGGVSRD